MPMYHVAILCLGVLAAVYFLVGIVLAGRELVRERVW